LCAAAAPFTLGLTLTGCRPLHANTPTRVESGLKYQSGQTDIDAFFAEYHEKSTEVDRATNDERTLRIALASELELTTGATPQVIVETVKARAQQLATKKIGIQLQTEGFGAEDEADTLVQAAVSGTLDDAARRFVEATTRCAREEMRLAARMRRAKKIFLKLTLQELALEPSIDGYFEGQGYAKQDEVRRNLLAVKRTLPLLSIKASDEADAREAFVKKLGQALTTDSGLARKAEPSLITSPDAAPAQKRGRAATSGHRKPAGTATPKPKSEPADAGGGDFDP
jgi:hypothetical protein